MADCFDRAPGAGRGRGRAGQRPGGRGQQRQQLEDAHPPGFKALIGEQTSQLTTSPPKAVVAFNQQQEPLRPPKTLPPLSEHSTDHLRKPQSPPAGIQDQCTGHDTGSSVTKSPVGATPTLISKLSVNAPEFYPSGYSTASTATSVPNFSYTGARLCNYLSHQLTINPQNGNFRQLLLKRCQAEYEKRDQAAKGDDATRKRFHAFVLFLGELFLNLEIKGTKGQVTRAEILQSGLRELLNALFSNPVDSNLICAVKLLKLTGSVLEDAWKEKGKADMEEIIQRMENVVLDASCSRDVKQMLLKLVELRSSNWGRVHSTSTYSEATPENDPNYFMNEPTFYTSEGVPFTAADPDYQEKYQELLDREDLFPDYEENGTDLSGGGDPYFDDIDDEMDPEIEEAFEKFCLESERKRKQ
ncbi:polyadenylate-binding protein-interacting protein 1 isoform X2 [Microcaecilia unicolor]|uniref:Polyadenylate-binding protein-interacting protein 1 n=1 Tax=Microcaecilia unicolor TaxID=1415580 RepID=A0A6P7XEA7_9AMPH|nr:polyadenylate-binding protein-interacting protein 1 isoform X2 [Microcaecilia unicolor]